jgi:WW domain-binding protein 4
MSKPSQQRKHEPWRSKERHYCAVCNTWMGSDRHSITLHENGKKHQENVTQSLQKKRHAKEQQDKQEQLLQQTLQRMNAAAHDALYTHDVAYYGLASHDNNNNPNVAVSHAAMTMTPPTVAPMLKREVPDRSKREDEKEWQSRKRQRQEEKALKYGKTSDDGEEEEAAPSHGRRYIAPDEGHYMLGEKTYLEGTVFGELLEEDMPIQYWTGHELASNAEKRLPDRHFYWKDAIVAAIRRRMDPHRPPPHLSIVVDLSYLQSLEDTEEKLVKSVPLDRIRIVLGSDPSLPSQLEEARLLAMGGTEVVLPSATATATTDTALPVDEATGLSGWTTVSIQRTSVRAEIKEERERARAERQALAAKEEQIQKETQARRMEEAKVANADDSALGAYDVYSQAKHGYKGVDILSNAVVDIHEMGKKLSEGKGAVSFKKAKKKVLNRRTTTSDD